MLRRPHITETIALDLRVRGEESGHALRGIAQSAMRAAVFGGGSAAT